MGRSKAPSPEPKKACQALTTSTGLNHPDVVMLRFVASKILGVRPPGPVSTPLGWRIAFFLLRYHNFPASTCVLFVSLGPVQRGFV